MLLPLCRCFNTDLPDVPVCELEEEMLCEGRVTCTGVDACHLGCPGWYQCKDSNKCVSRSTICDGLISTGCPEDDEWKTGIGFKCIRNGRVCRLPQQLLYDDITDCDNGEDICFFIPTMDNMAK